MNAAWFFGVLAVLAGLALASLMWRVRRYLRTAQGGEPIDLEVVSCSMGDRGPGDTMWMKTILSASLPNGRTRRLEATIQVHLDRIEEIQPGLILRGRVDPRDGEIDEYDYIQIDADHFAERES